MKSQTRKAPYSLSFTGEHNNFGFCPLKLYGKSYKHIKTHI